ncbi:hypothetical protein ATCC90586_008328 [Pythium insidiosum]|nr:hypothetical protein ATCC90586_008328 [Pythium insidiosum]
MTSLLAAQRKRVPPRHPLFARFASSLVTPEWLREKESDREGGRVHVISCDHPMAFHHGHIPFATTFGGLASTALKDTRGGSGVISEREFQHVVQSLGIEKDSTIVFYDDAMGIGATRAWWVFLHYGFPKENLKVLDGGWRQWVIDTQEISTDRDTPSTVSSICAGEHFGHSELTETGKLVGLESVQDALLHGSARFVDSRSHAEYVGADSHGNRRTGHVPGAVNLEWKDAVDFENNGRFKPSSELEHLVVQQAQLPVDRDQPLITYCQGGIRAAHTAFVLHEILGYRDVKIYEDSMMQYLNRDDTAVEP